MAKEQENTMNYSIHDDRVIGEVQIADEVVAIIAGLAATEVADGKVGVELAINMEYGYSIPEVTGTVQDKVKSAIETMTGLEVAEVNIRVAGVNLEDE